MPDADLQSDTSSPGGAALGPDEMAAVANAVDAWLDRELVDNPVLAAVERASEPGSSERRWFVRIEGEEKDVSTIRLTLRQRMLHHETYVLPAPEEDHARFHEHLMRRNRDLVGAAFCVGEEDAVFLVGAIPAATVDDDELDRILGTVWAAIERCFRPALRIGFASRLGA
ncbi:MAG: YbjN domain-containing protein [Actinomycetota bacterium]|nr:YbjN domain-containing protein [Actinomycetota bacterium]MEC9394443.1 YbjN domain-containing protein [Actinomycetota bacterium]MEE2958200.1 YbjN domain-containing protein [Actinomycetota bacterium]